MQITKTKLGLCLIKPDIYEDNRGVFMESWVKNKYKDFGINFDFVQDNTSKSNYGVIRGLHFQTDHFSQGKLIQVLDGKIFDVAVDINIFSPTYGQYESFILPSINKECQIFIPPGFAHGLQCLSKKTIISYKLTNYYNKESERTIIYDDKDININWPLKDPIVSEKDKKGIKLKDLWN